MYVVLCVVYLVDSVYLVYVRVCCFFFQAEDGIRDLVRSRGLGDVYKRQVFGLLGGIIVGIWVTHIWLAYQRQESTAKLSQLFLSLIHI